MNSEIKYPLATRKYLIEEALKYNIIVSSIIKQQLSTDTQIEKIDNTFFSRLNHLIVEEKSKQELLRRAENVGLYLPENIFVNSFCNSRKF